MNEALEVLRNKAVFGLFHEQLLECIIKNPLFVNVRILGPDVAHISFTTTILKCCSITYSDGYAFWHFYQNEYAWCDKTHRDDPLPEQLRQQIEQLSKEQVNG